VKAGVSILVAALSLGNNLSHAIAAADNDHVDISPVPAWVENIGVPTDEAVESPSFGRSVQYLLVDNQLRRDGDQTEFYMHRVSRILSHEGVEEGAELTFEFDPSYEQLAVHKIESHRGTNVLNRLSRDSLKVVQRERDLERRIYDGRLSVLVFPEDVRVGDVVEYAYTMRGSNPVFGDRYAESVVTGWAVPVRRMRVRVLWPSDRALQFRHHQSNLGPLVRKLGDQTEYVWEQSSVSAVVPEGDTPIWYQPYPWLQLSEFTNWADVVRWAAPLYAEPGELAPALRQKVDEWRERFADDEGRLLAALHFVQDEVRYLGIELGASSHAPADPNLVAERRFGDCKDKTLLLCSLLGALGIEAHPALVNTWARDTIEDWLPSPLCFNHVIARVKLGRNTYWIDPTRSHQRGRLNELYTPPYRWALVVSDGSDRLTKVTSMRAAEPILRAYERINAQSFTNPAALHLETTRYGLNAEEMRSYLAQTTQEQMDKEFANYHAQRFPQSRLQGRVRVTDDPVANVVRTTQDYVVPEFWSMSDDKQQWVRELSPSSLIGYTDKPRTVQRTMPLGIQYPLHIAHTIEVKLPKDWSLRSTNALIETAAIRFRYSRSFTNHVLRLNYEYDTLRDSVPATEVAEHLEALRRMNNWLTIRLYTPSEAAVAQARGPFGLKAINWSLIAICVLFTTLTMVGVVWLYRYKPKVPPPLPAQTVPNLRGIGGVLILPAIGVLIGPLLIAIQATRLHFVFDRDRWLALTSADGAAYHPLWAPLLTGELLANLFMVCFGILLAIVFFQRRRIAVWLYITLLVVQLVIQIADHAFAQHIPALVQHSSNTSDTSLFRSVGACLVWIPYFLISRRVKATFVN